MPDTPPCIECKHMSLDNKAPGRPAGYDLCTLGPEWVHIADVKQHTCAGFRFLPGARPKDPTVCETETCDNKRDFEWATICAECRARLQDEDAIKRKANDAPE